jgi:hypothetical protein
MVLPSPSSRLRASAAHHAWGKAVENVRVLLIEFRGGGAAFGMVVTGEEVSSVDRNGIDGLGSGWDLFPAPIADTGLARADLIAP